jgi:hypothetical protein
LSKQYSYVQNFSSNKQSYLAEFQQTANESKAKNGKWQSLATAIMLQPVLYANK